MIRLVTLFILVIATQASAQDWPQWRGPNRDGVVQGAKFQDKWPKELTRLWQITVGEGHSSPVFVNDRIYLLTRLDNRETVACFKASNGEEIWKYAYDSPYKVNDAASDHGKGPKSTPAVAEGRIYTLGISGILTCLDAAKGKLLWQKQFGKEFKITSPLYGTATSPLIVEGLCIAHVGGHDKGSFAAFDTKTGELKWSASGDGPGYASPILATLGGKKQIVTLTQNEVITVNPSDGKMLWKLPYTTGYDQNTITPVVYQDLVIYSGYQKPLEAVRVVQKDGKFSTEPAWENKDCGLYMSSPVLIGDRLIGLSMKRSGFLFCANAKDGKIIWQSEGRFADYASILSAGNLALVLTNAGQLIVVDGKADKYQPVATYTVADTPTWAHPVLFGDRLLIKDREKLTLWQIK
jgi:outer membrane protein assembly factor BamB